MNEKEYKIYTKILKELEKVKNKPIPKSCEKGVERRKKILDSWVGMGI